MRRVPLLLIAAVLGGGLAAFAVNRQSRPAPPLVVLVAASLRPVAEQVAAEYGEPIEFRFGGSEELVAQIRLTSDLAPADLFLPADASYLDACGPHAAVSPPLTTMHAVALTRRESAPADWAALTAPGVRLGIASPRTAAVGKLTKRHLDAGRWDALNARLAVTTDTVTQSANGVKLGTLDAAIVWDATARQFAPDLVGTPLPELAGVRAEVRAAVLTGSRRPAAAAALLAYLAGAEGRRAFSAHGFAPPDGPSP